MNRISVKTRLLELLIDYFVICGYLLLLLMFNLLLINIFKIDTNYKELTSQLIAMLTSIVPIVILFSILDWKKGTFGKQKAQLKLHYQNKTFSNSLARNVIKFTPWHLSHLGIIHGMYSDFDITAQLLVYSSLLLGSVMLIMTLFTKSKRHLGDYLAGTTIISD